MHLRNYLLMNKNSNLYLENIFIYLGNKRKRIINKMKID